MHSKAIDGGSGSGRAALFLLASSDPSTGVALLLLDLEAVVVHVLITFP
jgi:hypothetical protein